MNYDVVCERSRSAASAPVAPATAAPPADAATSHRVRRGSRGHAVTVTATSRASESAPAADHAPAEREPPDAARAAVSAPRRRARSRAHSARPNTWAPSSSADAPTHGRAGTDGQTSAAAPSPTRPTATAVAEYRNSGRTADSLLLSLAMRTFLPPGNAPTPLTGRQPHRANEM